MFKNDARANESLALARFSALESEFGDARKKLGAAIFAARGQMRAGDFGDNFLHEEQRNLVFRLH